MIDYPALTSDHIAQYARLFANRRDLIEALPVSPFQVVAEVGVAFGDFSRFLIDVLKPRKFVAVDTFVLHEYAVVMGEPLGDKLHGLKHEVFYRRHIPEAIVVKALSHDGMELLDDEEAALIYLDAGHLYEDLQRDLEVANRKLASGGILCLNDYTLWDHDGRGKVGGSYGVVQAANEFIAAGSWEVIGFAFERNMFCDIALRRTAAIMAIEETNDHREQDPL